MMAATAIAFMANRMLNLFELIRGEAKVRLVVERAVDIFILLDQPEGAVIAPSDWAK
jgi:hypothetical protein